MGLRGISIGSIILILVIVLIVFGARRLRSVGEDLGNALQGFRKGLREAQKEDNQDHRHDDDELGPEPTW